MGAWMKCACCRDSEEARVLKYEYIGTCCKGQVIYKVYYSDGTRFDQKCCTCDGPGKAIPKKNRCLRGCAHCWSKCDK